MSEEETPKMRKIPYFHAIIIMILILSIVALYRAMTAYLSTPPGISEGNRFITIGTIGLAMSVYMLFRARSRMPRITSETQRVATIIQCEKCDFKKIRAFERDDYIFKEAEPCPKCDENMTIASIHREVEEKKKS